MNCINGTSVEKSVVEAEFSDTLTSSSCTIIVAEIIKYILYHKQQLPYTFERLKYVITKKRSLKEWKNNRSVTSSNTERLFRVAEGALTTLEALFEQTRREISGKGRVNEIALLFGGTPMSPKQVYHIHLPEVYCNNSLENHSDRNYLIQLLQSIIQCNQLNEMLMTPMGITNMYVFIRKRSNYNAYNISSWFLPKNRFQIPFSGQHFHIKLSQPASEDGTSSCRGFSVYCDNAEPSTSEPSVVEECRIDTGRKCETETEWYQACEIFKGFKDVFVNGVSVSESWLR